MRTRNGYKLYAPGERRKNPFFVVRGRTPDGREFEVSTHTTDEEAAPRIAATIFARLCAEYPSFKPALITFSDAADAYIRWRNPRKADLARIERLRATLGDLPVAEVAQDDLVRAANQHRNVTGATLNRDYVRPFAAILHYARDAGMRGDIRVRAFKERAPQVRVAKREDVLALIASAKTEHQRLLLNWTWDLGTRISDTLRVSWDDLDLTNATVRLTIGKARDAIISLPLTPTLVTTLANIPSKRGRLFPWATKSGVYKWLKPLCEQVGVMFRPHDARRALATEQFDAGADARLVQELMGHQSVKSTMRYRHVGVTRMAAQQRKRSGQ
jgi:integrase